MNRNSLIGATFRGIAVLVLVALTGDVFAQETGTPIADGAPPTSASSASRLEQLLAARPRIDRTLTLDEAVAIALRESPVVRGAVAEVEAAEGRVQLARSQTRPFVSANTFVSGGSNASIVASPPLVQPPMIMALPRDGFVDQNLSVMYPLYTGGRLSALVRQAAALRDASAAEREMQRQEVALLTRTAYREVIARRALVEVQRARLQENEERLRLDRVRLQQEQIPVYYVSRDEAEVAQAKQELTNAQRDVDIGLLQLKTVMGVHPASQIEVVAAPSAVVSAGDVVSRLAGKDADLTALLRVAERNRPELAAAARRVHAVEAGASAARGAYRPQVNLFGMGDALKVRGQDAFAGVTYGLVASLPLYNGGQERADRQTADAERRRAEQDEQRIALQVAQEVQTALLNLRAAEQNVTTAKLALTAAHEEYRVVRLRYEAGRSIVTEVLDAQTSRTRAEANLVQARFQFDLANDQLQRAVGSILSGTKVD